MRQPFSNCCFRPQIWNHPDVLYMAAQKQKKNSLAEDNDIDLEEIQEAAAGTKKAGNKVGKTGPVTPEQKNQSSPKPQQEISKVFAMMDRKEQSVSYEWVRVFTYPYLCHIDVFLYWRMVVHIMHITAFSQII